MIIKKINFQDLDQELYFKLKHQIQSRPRFYPLQPHQQKEYMRQRIIKQTPNLKQSISFNDRQYFNNQSLLLNMRKLKVGFPMHKTYIRKLSNKKRQQQQPLDPSFQLMAVNTQKAVNLFQTFNQQDISKQNDNKPFYAENNYSQGKVRNYSSLSCRNKRDIYNTISLNEQSDYSKTLQKGSSRFVKGRQDLKLHKANKSCCQVNPYTNKKYLHKRLVSQKRNDSKMKSLDYSIIKPNQIVSAPLTHRNYLPIQFPSTPTSFKRNYPQLMQKIKRKEDLLKKEIEKLKRQKQQKHMEGRRKMHSSYGNRIRLIPQQANEVLPWQVQGLSNLADIL